jgi:hypothetical protein
MSRRRLLTAALAVVCLIALSASAVALARSSSSSSGHHATPRPATRHVGEKHRHHPCPKYHQGDGRMTPGSRSTSAPLT